MSAKPATARRPSARERLLDAADELFYEEGVHSVGIDRVIAHAGVAKASLYSAFGSKDELIRAYLDRRHALRRERMQTRLAQYATPRDQLLGVFDVLRESYALPTSRGCAFINAGAEARDGTATTESIDAYRAWVRGLFVDRARAAGVADPEGLAAQLHLLYDGSAVGVRMDHAADPAVAAKAAATVLVDAALQSSCDPQPPRPVRSPKPNGNSGS